MIYNITVKDEVSSTNDCIKELIAAGAPEGAVVRAKRQVGGYGRRGNPWTSPEGGLYMSVLLRPAECKTPVAPDRLMVKLPTLSLLAGLAVRRGVCRLLPAEKAERVKVKWPNDVLVEQPDGTLQKLSGISLEGTPEALCLGIGVNVAPVEGRASVQDMAEVTIDEVAESVLDAFAGLYEQWLVNPFAVFLEEYNQVNVLAERSVSVEVGSERVKGTFIGVDERGCMLLHQGDGIVRPIASGEAHIVPMA